MTSHSVECYTPFRLGSRVRRPRCKWRDGKRGISHRSPFFHTNPLGTTTVVTSQTGAVQEDQIVYPWGQSWHLYLNQADMAFATMEPYELRSGEDIYYSQTRSYSGTYGR